VRHRPAVVLAATRPYFYPALALLYSPATSSFPDHAPPKSTIPRRSQDQKSKAGGHAPEMPKTANRAKKEKYRGQTTNVVFLALYFLYLFENIRFVQILSKSLKKGCVGN
jgi:hypothetical protein